MSQGGFFPGAHTINVTGSYFTEVVELIDPLCEV